MIGSVFADSPVGVNGPFETTFAFRISQLVSGGADGMCFVIANDPRGATALGDDGQWLGYGYDPINPPSNAINNSLVVEIDTYFGTGDLSDNEISIQTGGNGVNNSDAAFSIGRITPPINMSDGNVHVMRISYTPGTLAVYLDDLVTPKLSVAYDIMAGGTWVVSGTPVGGLGLIGGSQAYVGFASATGLAWEDHDVLWWNWDSSFGPPPVAYCTAKINSLGCVPAIASDGIPSGASSGFTVSATNVRNQKAGVLLYTLDGRKVTPFQGGFVCLAPAIRRTPALNSGGHHFLLKDCSGGWRIDMNAFAAGVMGGQPAAGLHRPGSSVHCQWWGRDPDDPFGSALTDALRYELAP
jgi:hypothetical protein